MTRRHPVTQGILPRKNMGMYAKSCAFRRVTLLQQESPHDRRLQRAGRSLSPAEDVGKWKLHGACCSGRPKPLDMSGCWSARRSRPQCGAELPIALSPSGERVGRGGRCAGPLSTAARCCAPNLRISPLKGSEQRPTIGSRSQSSVGARIRAWRTSLHLGPGLHLGTCGEA